MEYFGYTITKYHGFDICKMPRSASIYGIKSFDGRITITGFLSEDAAKKHIDKRFRIKR